MIWASVDSPAPFSPTRPCTSPARRSKSTSCRALTPGNDLWMPCARSATEVLGAASRGAPGGVTPPVLARLLARRDDRLLRPTGHVVPRGDDDADARVGAEGVADHLE